MVGKCYAIPVSEAASRPSRQISAALWVTREEINAEGEHEVCRLWPEVLFVGTHSLQIQLPTACWNLGYKALWKILLVGL